MLLAIDAGNTNIVFAVMEGGEVRARWRIATDARRTADQYAVWLRQLMQFADIDPFGIKSVIISTVVPRALHNLTQLAEKYLGCTALVAGRGEADYGLVVDVEEPGSLGADRAVNAVAAHAAHDGDLIVIDFGTATTFDHIDYTGAYKGGIIAPGINLSLDALVAAAAKLPNIAIEAPATNSVIGRNTEEQMHIGVYWGYVAMMEGIVQRMRTEIGRPTKVIATGGLAQLFDKHTRLFDAVEPDLTLNGLAQIAARVESKS